MFWENFLKLCDGANQKPTAVVVALEISRGSVTHWKAGKVPQHATLLKIAKYFNVTVDELLAESLPARDPYPPADTLYPLDGQDIHMVPLFESVSAGFGTLAVNEIIDYIPTYIPDSAEARETICIKVHGDSMFPKIEDGDVIQVHKQESVDSGSIAVVILDGEEGLVKKVVYGDTWVELHSFNPLYKIQRFNGRDVLRVRVVGLVKKIIKEV